MKRIVTIVVLFVSVALFSFNYKNIMGIPESFFKREIQVRATIYKPYKKNNVTADGYKFKTHVSDTTKIIAVSRDLLKEYPMGSKVLVLNAGKLSGLYTIRDKMARRWRNKIDILVDRKHSLARYDRVRLILIDPMAYVESGNNL